MSAIKEGALCHLIMKAASMMHVSMGGACDRGFRADASAIILSLLSAMDAVQAAATEEEVTLVVHAYESEAFTVMSCDPQKIEGTLYWRYKACERVAPGQDDWARFREALCQVLKEYTPEIQEPKEEFTGLS